MEGEFKGCKVQVLAVFQASVRLYPKIVCQASEQSAYQ